MTMTQNTQTTSDVRSPTTLQIAAAKIEIDSATNTIYCDDNGIDLTGVLDPYFRPDKQTIVCGALDSVKIAALAKAGVELVINLQTADELNFDEAAAVTQAGMCYQQLPISGADDLKQLKILAFDNILRQYHGKKVAMHCGTGNRVGAAMALRAGWLRGRKMETSMERGRSHGLSSLEPEVYNRLLVPR